MVTKSSDTSDEKLTPLGKQCHLAEMLLKGMWNFEWIEKRNDYSYDFNDNCRGRDSIYHWPLCCRFFVYCLFVHLFAFRIMTGHTHEESVRRYSKFGQTWPWVVQGVDCSIQSWCSAPIATTLLFAAQCLTASIYNFTWWALWPLESCLSIHRQEN